MAGALAVWIPRGSKSNGRPSMGLKIENFTDDYHSAQRAYSWNSAMVGFLWLCGQASMSARHGRAAISERGIPSANFLPPARVRPSPDNIL
jgi:hypothetical protein